MISIAVFCSRNLKCLLVIFADQVFIDPTFLGTFVCSPLRSSVVNVYIIWGDTARNVLRFQASGICKGRDFTS